MRSDVHAAALRAATKVAFSVAFLGGCSAGPDAEDGKGASGDPGTSASDVIAAKPDAEADAKKTLAPAPSVAANCDAVIEATFPQPDHYPGTVVGISPEAQACCVEELIAHRSQFDHRWDCCANIALDDQSEKVVIACSPWGPPVPPSMTRRVKRAAPLPRPEMWMAVA